jgi:hypothetical protein
VELTCSNGITYGALDHESGHLVAGKYDVDFLPSLACYAYPFIVIVGIKPDFFMQFVGVAKKGDFIV